VIGAPADKNRSAGALFLAVSPIQPAIEAQRGKIGFTTKDAKSTKFKSFGLRNLRGLRVLRGLSDLSKRWDAQRKFRKLRMISYSAI
jgi:hypothetical protein